MLKEINLENLEKLLWSSANTVRDKFGVENGNLHEIILPTIILKRIMDQREDIINDELKTTKSYKSGKVDIVNVYKTKKNLVNSIYKTKKDETFFITFTDIINFTENAEGIEREIPLAIDENICIKSSAKNIVEFLEEIAREFDHKVLKNVLIESDYFKVYLSNEKKVKPIQMTELLDDYNEMFFGKNIEEDIFSKAYMYLINQFASGAGKKGGEFFTPDEICELVVNCLEPKIPKKGNLKFGDITSGSATFLIMLARKLMKKNKKSKKRLEIYAQELVPSSLLMGEVGLLLSGLELLNIYNGNSITEYKDNIGQHRQELDIVIGNPPYGLKDYGHKWTTENSDSEQRWNYGTPKKGDGEYAFMQTALDMIHSKGKVGLVLPLGTLFKDSTKIQRQKFIEQDIIEGIIVLPGNMFQTTGIPTCIWIFNKDKKEEDKGKIYMIDTTNTAIKSGKFNTIDYNKVVDYYTKRFEEEGFSGYVEIADIKENEWNLSVQRYIFKDEPEEEIDIVKLVNEIKELEKEILTQKVEMDLIINQALELENNKTEENLVETK